MEKLQLLQDTVDGKCVLRAPGVGTYTGALERGRLVRAGDSAGVLELLGRTFALIVPQGVRGRVENAPPERVFQPVSHGDVLLELSPLDDAAESTEIESDREAAGGPVLRAPYSGRFWQRPAPGEPAFTSVGDTLQAGATVGLLEVMKTFTHLAYPSDGSLPAPARVARILVDDGAEVSEGDPILEVETS